MNVFDAVVLGMTLVAVGMGFHAGLLRSLATILGYLIAAPLVAAVAPRVMGLLLGQQTLPPEQLWLELAVLFIFAGVVVSALLRAAVSEFAGPDIGLFDRLAGALLGALRIFLVAVLIVIVFDQVIPADRQPEFLATSKLRPYLSAAGQRGLETLPPDVEDYIARLKRQHGL
jgi:membrane protein required for colicin V production